MQNTTKVLSLSGSIIRRVASTTAYVSIFCVAVAFTWLASPFMEAAGLNLPIVNKTSGDATIPLQKAYGQNWVSMPAGAKSAYLGIQGGTVPLTLMRSPNGALIALPGRSGHDFMETLSGNPGKAAYNPAYAPSYVFSEDNKMISGLLADPEKRGIQHTTGAPMPTWVPFGLGHTYDEDILSSENSIPAFGNSGAAIRVLDNKEASRIPERTINTQSSQDSSAPLPDKLGKPLSNDHSLHDLNSAA